MDISRYALPGVPVPGPGVSGNVGGQGGWGPIVHQTPDGKDWHGQAPAAPAKEAPAQRAPVKVESDNDSWGRDYKRTRHHRKRREGVKAGLKVLIMQPGPYKRKTGVTLRQIDNAMWKVRLDSGMEVAVLTEYLQHKRQHRRKVSVASKTENSSDSDGAMPKSKIIPMKKSTPTPVSSPTPESSPSPVYSPRGSDYDVEDPPQRPAPPRPRKQKKNGGKACIRGCLWMVILIIFALAAASVCVYLFKPDLFSTVLGYGGSKADNVLGLDAEGNPITEEALEELPVDAEGNPEGEGTKAPAPKRRRLMVKDGSRYPRIMWEEMRRQ